MTQGRRITGSADTLVVSSEAFTCRAQATRTSHSNEVRGDEGGGSGRGNAKRDRGRITGSADTLVSSGAFVIERERGGHLIRTK